MYRFILSLLLISSLASAQVKKGYEIQIKIKNAKDQPTYYLAHYYGRALTVYKTDSVKLNSNGVGTLKSNEKIIGGLYLLLKKDNSAFAEFILNPGDKLKFTADNEDFTDGFEISGSEDNKIFLEYKEYLKGFEQDRNKILARLAQAKTAADSAKVTDALKDNYKVLNEYREKVYNMYPKSFVSKMFGAMYEPETPSPSYKLLPDGSVDSAYGYYYVMKHYWDRFPFDDERVAYSPIYHDKIQRYFEKLVMPIADSVSQNALWLLDTTSSADELFRYTLWYVNSFIWTSKIMGVDAAIIPIAEKYYQDPKNVFWTDSAGYEKMMKKILLMKPSQIGSIGQNLELKDRKGNKQMLHDIPAEYLVMVFWAPDCGHCRKEMPKIDSFYRAQENDFNGIQLVGIKTEGDSSLYETFIEENHLTDHWILLDDDLRKSNMRYFYDVETTPMIIILDEKRKIIAKKINFDDILNIINFDKLKKAKSSNAN